MSGFSYRKLSIDFRHFLVFVFCNRALSKTRKPRETIYLVCNTFLSILCDQDLTLKVLLKVIKEDLQFKLEGSFFVIKAKIVLR